ncbi:superoxide dismutase family protein [Sphingomonas sp. ac-8]|uniref:superoxide dismutase family protein n=1 Tax=Sphingomonas sp. ac-8 TaxID=3242977 RepID=UPI003A80274F
MKTHLALLAATGLMAACTQTAPADMAGTSQSDRVATANLRTATNASVGTATATEVPGGVRIALTVNGVPQGPHGVHVHTTGRCDAPDFTTAGGHWNPTSMQHGSKNPAGPHAGDMPNLLVGTDGTGSIEFTLPSGTFEGLLDADGSAFVVHAGADDLMTDPSGNSGGRFACGVFNAA